MLLFPNKYLKSNLFFISACTSPYSKNRNDLDINLARWNRQRITKIAAACLLVRRSVQKFRSKHVLVLPLNVPSFAIFYLKLPEL